jgi:hypothetical protein
MLTRRQIVRLMAFHTKKIAVLERLIKKLSEKRGISCVARSIARSRDHVKRHRLTVELFVDHFNALPGPPMRPAAIGDASMDERMRSWYYGSYNRHTRDITRPKSTASADTLSFVDQVDLDDLPADDDDGSDASLDLRD